MIKKYFSWLQKDNPTGLVEKYPELDNKKQTSLHGVYITGDLTGIPLIKLAADSGARLVRDFEYEKDFSTRKGQNKDIYDVLIVGAGPAGLSAAIECQKRGLNYLLVESSQPFNTIENFPKGKPILIRPNDFESASAINVSDGNKESLLKEMKKQVAQYNINIQNGIFISELKRQNNIIIGKTPKDEEFSALRVILAIGKSGNARKLGVKGEELPHVFNKLYDPEEFSEKNILVVGGGDSSIEVTIALAKTGNTVYHSYRKDTFARPKEENITAFEELTQAGKIIPLFSSQINEIRESNTTVKTSEGEKDFPIDAVFSMIGRELPTQFFKRSGIKMEGEKGATFWIFLTCMLGFFSMMYFGKASSSMAVFAMGDSFADKINAYLKAPFTRDGMGTVKDTILFCLAWVGSLIFITSGIIALGIIIKNRSKYFGTTWNKIKYTYLTLVGIFLTWIYIRYNIGANQVGWSPQITQNFSLVYCLTMLVFGIRRMIVRKTKYIKLQVISLLTIQIFFLYLLPFYFYDYILQWFGSESWFMTQVLPDRWACFALILFWPLYIVQFGQTAFWTWFPFVQSGLFLFLIIRYFGKGVFCGWICSCGGMAETMGDEYRHLAPHGAKAKKYENIGQFILLAAVILTILRFGLGVSSAHEVPVLGGMYKILVDSLFAGVIGIGLYFFWGGRIWCRFGCPLAALMNIYTRFSKYRILSEKKKCISCNICTKVCHMGIDVMNYANKGIPMNDAQCVRCSACVQSCPMDVLAFGSVAADIDNKGRESVPIYGKDDWKAGIQ